MSNCTRVPLRKRRVNVARQVQEFKTDVGAPTGGWKLRRAADGLVKTANQISWVQFWEGEVVKETDRPTLGYCLVMGALGAADSIQTAPLQDIIQDLGDYVKFQTEFAIWELWKKD